MIHAVLTALLTAGAFATLYFTRPVKTEVVYQPVVVGPTK